jgi:cobalt-zinc-cadmium resistance protein CzcA
MQRLGVLMNYPDSFNILPAFVALPVTADSLVQYPAYRLLQLENKSGEASLRIEKNKLLPDFSLNYFIGTNHQPNSKYYHGFEVGLSMPLIFAGQQAQAKSSEIALNAQQMMTQNKIALLKNRWDEINRELQKYRELIEYYNTTGKQLYDEILRTSQLSFQNGEIDLFRFTYSFENAILIRMDYLDNLLSYNTLITEQMYLSNQE